MTTETTSPEEIEMMRGAIRKSSMWNAEMEPFLAKMLPTDVQLLAEKLRIAAAGGGFALEEELTEELKVVRAHRVNAGGKLRLSDGRITYTNVPYDLQGISRGPGEVPQLHAMYAGNRVCVEKLIASDLMLPPSPLLVASSTAGKLVVAAYQPVSDDIAELQQVGVHYGYTSGMRQSRPPAGTLLTQRVTALDAVMIDPGGNPAYKYNGQEGREVPMPRGGLYHIEGSNTSVRVDTQHTENIMRVMLRERDRTVQQRRTASIDIPFFIGIPPGLDSLQFDPKRAQESGYAMTMDTLVEKLFSFRPRATPSQHDTRAASALAN